MAPHRFAFGRLALTACALSMVGAVVACAPYQRPSSPTQVSSQSPSVTYNYRTDQDLLQARQNAEAYCVQFQSAPMQGTVSTNPDGTKTVVFNCNRAPGVAVAGPVLAPANAAVSYTYLSDADFAQAANNAEAHCMRYASRTVSSNIITNPNGSKTATFQCGPR